MVKIIFGEHSQQADLAGKSVAEARELYKSEFGIPDRAQASLNDQQLKKKLEPETRLSDEDKLAFEEKSRRGLVLLGAFLLALTMTAGLFAYTMTTQSVTLLITGGDADYATVTANMSSALNYAVLGRYRGTIPPGNLFDVTVDSDYNGDLAVNVYLSNAEVLSKDYASWLMRVEFTDVGGDPIDTDNTTQLLTLDNTMVTFEVDVGANMTAVVGYTGYVQSDGGSYKTFRHGWVTAEDPIIWAQVVQAANH